MVIKGPQSKSTKYTHPTFAKTKGNKIGTYERNEPCSYKLNKKRKKKSLNINPDNYSTRKDYHRSLSLMNIKAKKS